MKHRGIPAMEGADTRQKTHMGSSSTAQAHSLAQSPSSSGRALYPPIASATTQVIQEYLDENKKLIIAILDNQNHGKLNECAILQQKLQSNLMFLAAVADGQRQQAIMHVQHRIRQNAAKVSFMTPPAQAQQEQGVNAEARQQQMTDLQQSTHPQVQQHQIQPQSQHRQTHPGAQQQVTHAQQAVKPERNSHQHVREVATSQEISLHKQQHALYGASASQMGRIEAPGPSLQLNRGSNSQTQKLTDIAAGSNAGEERGSAGALGGSRVWHSDVRSNEDVPVAVKSLYPLYGHGGASKTEKMSLKSVDLLGGAGAGDQQT